MKKPKRKAAYKVKLNDTGKLPTMEEINKGMESIKKRMPKKMAKGGLVKGFLKKRYDEAHSAKKEVPIPRLKPKSKP